MHYTLSTTVCTCTPCQGASFTCKTDSFLWSHGPDTLACKPRPSFDRCGTSLSVSLSSISSSHATQLVRFRTGAGRGQHVHHLLGVPARGWPIPLSCALSCKDEESRDSVRVRGRAMFNTWMTAGSEDHLCTRPKWAGTGLAKIHHIMTNATRWKKDLDRNARIVYLQTWSIDLRVEHKIGVHASPVRKQDKLAWFAPGTNSARRHKGALDKLGWKGRVPRWRSRSVAPPTFPQSRLVIISVVLHVIGVIPLGQENAQS